MLQTYALKQSNYYTENAHVDHVADIQNKNALQMLVYFSSAKQLPWSITIWCFTALKSCSALLIGLDSFTNFLIYSNATSDLLTDLFF